MSDDISARLLDAHTAYVLAQCSGEALRNQIALEVEAAFERLASVPLDDVITADQVAGILIEQVQTAPVTAESRALVQVMLSAFRQSPQNATVRVRDIVSREDYDTLIDRVARMEEVRRKVIHGALGSPLYAGLISDVLFNGIRDYLLSDNSMAMKIPGVGSLMKMGKWGLDKTLPNFEQSLEKTLKGYIESNIGRTLGLSEKFLDNSLNAANIHKLSDHLWTLLNEPTVRDAVDAFPESEVEGALALVDEWWSRLRGNAHIAQWVRDCVQGFYAAYGQRALGPWLVSMGWDAAHVTDVLQRTLPSMLERPVVQQYIEERTRAQLRAFYESDLARNAMTGV